MAEPLEIQQVLVNLVQNATQALAVRSARQRRIDIRTYVESRLRVCGSRGHGARISQRLGRGLLCAVLTQPSRKGWAWAWPSVGPYSNVIKADCGEKTATKAVPSSASVYHDPQSMNPQPTNRPTVFVVDDDQQMLDSLTALLAAMKFTARAFASADEFHRFYAAIHAGLPRARRQNAGAGRAGTLRAALREGKRVPVIFITAHADVSTGRGRHENRGHRVSGKALRARIATRPR